MLTVGVLGPLLVSVNGRRVELTSPTLRTLLVVLAMSADSPVSVDRLAAALWDEDLPEHLRRAVQTHLTRLRSALGAGLIVTEPAGYRMRVDPEQVDALRFARLLDLAAQAPDVVTERGHLATALALWRGSPLEDVRSDLLDRRRDHLIERYLAAVERRVDLDLRDGRSGDVVVQLQELTALYPLREPLWVRLLTALARSGRQAEALAQYGSIRRRLVEELGTDPGPGLQQIHAELLAAGPPEATSATSAVVTMPVVVPRQLPADINGFIGRAAALKALRTLVDDWDRSQPTKAATISVIAGMAGIGKTTLAVHWAHEIADRFPDGQLYVNLRGFHPSAQAVAPGEAVRRFLDALGVPPPEIPADPDAQVAMYRSLLSTRRMLVVLDNARDPDQVRPLLPGPTCLVLVTSRSRLTGLVATEAARPLMVDLFPQDEARDLLATRLGPERLAAEPEAVNTIIARCAGLPLALAVAAARAATSSLALATLANQLDDEQSTLDTLDTGDPSANARVVFSWSYRALSPSAARMFRLLGLHPAPDFATAAVASLVGVAPARARSPLAELLDVHLVIEHSPDRYAVHDLLRAHATELVHSDDGDIERRAALHRLFDHYLHTAHSAAQALNPQRGDRIAIVPPRPGVTPECPANYEQALAWFTAEHAVLLAVVEHAASTGFDTHVWQFAWTTMDFHYRRGHWHDWLTTQHAGLESARRLADRSVQARAHRFIATAYAQMGRHADAHPHFQTALELYRQLGNTLGEGQTLLNLGAHLSRQDCYPEALHHCRLAFDKFVAVDYRPGQALALNAIGWYHAQLGDYHAALSHCQRALALQQELGDRNNEASTWDSLGYAHHQLGHHQQAMSCYQQAIALYEELGIRFYQAVALSHLGDTYNATGEVDRAHTTWQWALTILDELEHPQAAQIRAKLERPMSRSSAHR